MIRKILVANRGEIACRVFRTCKRLGIGTVAVFSDADAQAMHVREADESFRLGPAPAAESYLRIDQVIAAAKATGADAIHPGYGFLSERAEFVDACNQAGITFIGPSSAAMHKLGSKIDAKQLAVAASVPITPGFFEIGASPEALKEAADSIGYPVMVKASAGGGGRGMKIVRSSDEFLQELHLASEEAVRSFGDGAMMVEKLVEAPRHIEVQFIRDTHGQTVCLFERECSLQRRHQKVVEEAPSPVMTDELWHAMRACTIRLVEAADYVGAGTAEFMLDSSTGEFYFLEVNARLQVEHPVTEAITGLDLVETQIQIAQGGKLALPEGLVTGDRSFIRGHAIEVRVIAEDPAQGFLPSVGKIVGWAEPAGPGVRFDTGFEEGAEVTPFYDSMLAKLVVHAPDRAQAISGTLAALRDTHILGIKTNGAFVQDVIAAPEFATADFDTGFLGRRFGNWQPGPAPDWIANVIAFGSAAIVATGEGATTGETPAWSTLDRFRNARS